MSQFPCCKGIGLTSTEAKTEKKDMQELNNRLAFFIQWVRELKSASSAGGDMSGYHDAMKQLEGELVKLKALYEAELEKLRGMLFQANSEKSQLVLETQKMSSSHGRLSQEASKASQLEISLRQLEKTLAERERELAEMRALLKHRDQEASCASKYLAECENLKLRLSEESQQRRNFEAKLKELSSKYSFDVQVHGNQQKDLQERVQAANAIIMALEAKMKKLNSIGGDLPAALQKLREGTVVEMQKFQGETEAALNRNIEMIRQQMESSAQAQQSLAMEKRQMQAQIKELSARLMEFEAQNKALVAENKALRADIDSERSRVQLSIKELEAKLKELQNHLLCHTKEFVHARDAQASLRTEIDAYRVLLEAESGRVNCRGQFGSGVQISGSNTSLPVIGKSSAGMMGQSSTSGDGCASGSYKASFEMSSKGFGNGGKSADVDKNLSFSWSKTTKASPSVSGGYRGTTNSYDTTYKATFAPHYGKNFYSH